MNTLLEVQIFLNVINMVSRGVLECHVGCCNHGIDVTSVVLINFILFSKPKYVFKICMLINDIIIIMSCRQHGYPWPSLATSPYHSSPPAGLLGYIPCPHIAAVCKFGLVVLLLLGHMLGVHRSTSLTSSSLLLQQCPACLTRLTCIVFVMGGRWPYNWRLVGCCRQNLFNIALNILV